MFTEKELEILARILGHHVTGTAADELYEKLLRLVPEAGNMAPFQKTCKGQAND